MLVAFSKTRKEPNPTCVKFDSQALEPIWFPTAASYLRTVSKHSVNFLTKRGEEKREGKQEGKRKGAPPEPRPSQREARPGQGAAGGERGRTLLGWAKHVPRFLTSVHAPPCWLSGRTAARRVKSTPPRPRAKKEPGNK